MNRFRKPVVLLVAFGLGFLLVAAVTSPITPRTEGRLRPPLQSTPIAEAIPVERPFRLPFAEPSGPNTWLMAQPYGNTTGAYFQRYTTYGASGGIHFGVDLAAPCGTEIVAIADGVVFAVDGPFGSPPHNLMIDHAQLGYASMYGHLLEPPRLTPGQFVEAGQVIALVGTSGRDCDRGAHLHLEIRDLKHFRKFNPATLIEADWNRLTLYGNSGRGFMRDLDEPRKWQTLFDQPEVQTGGPIVNDFVRTWPMSWEGPEDEGETTARPTATPELETESSIAPPTATPRPPTSTPEPRAVDPSLPVVRQITTGNCCTNPYWNAASTEVRFIDKPSSSQPVGLYGIDITQVEAEPRLIVDRFGIYNEDGSLIAYPDRARDLTVIERVADGRRWELDTDGNRVSFTPGGRLLWTVSDSDIPWERRQNEIWLADADGSNAEVVATLERGGPSAWLSDTELLISSRVPPARETLLSVLSLEDGSMTDLVELPPTRGGSFSPDKRYLAFMVRLEVADEEEKLWLVDLQAARPKPERLLFFGAFRWRDNESLIYVPFDPETNEQIFYEHNVRSGKSRQLFPTDQPAAVPPIANNDWQVSPDGRKIALVAADGENIDGIWVIELDRENRARGGR